MIAWKVIDTNTRQSCFLSQFITTEGPDDNIRQELQRFVKTYNPGQITMPEPDSIGILAFLNVNDAYQFIDLYCNRESWKVIPITGFGEPINITVLVPLQQLNNQWWKKLIRYVLSNELVWLEMKSTFRCYNAQASFFAEYIDSYISSAPKGSVAFRAVMALA